MKILVFTDLHADEEAYLILKRNIKREKPDLLINCGDFTLFGRSIDSWTKKLDFGIKMLVIPGNHESEEEIRKIARKFKYIVNVHKKFKKIGNILFLGVGGGGFSDELFSLDDVQKRFEDKIKAFRKKYSDGKVVLISHVPPYRTKQDNVYGEYVGAKNLSWFIRHTEVDYCFCGHIHENARTKDRIGKTIVVNSGPDGMVFEI